MIDKTFILLSVLAITISARPSYEDPSWSFGNFMSGFSEQMKQNGEILNNFFSKLNKNLNKVGKNVESKINQTSIQFKEQIDQELNKTYSTDDLAKIVYINGSTSDYFNYGGCTCLDFECYCCAQIDQPQFDFNKTICFNFRYLNDDYKIDLQSNLAENVTLNKTFFPKDNSKICVGKTCLIFYNTNLNRKEFSGCVDFLLNDQATETKIGCFFAYPEHKFFQQSLSSVIENNKLVKNVNKFSNHNNRDGIVKQVDIFNRFSLPSIFIL